MASTPPKQEVPHEDPSEKIDVELKPHELVPEAINEASSVRLESLTSRQTLIKEMDQEIVKRRINEVQKQQAV